MIDLVIQTIQTGSIIKVEVPENLPIQSLKNEIIKQNITYRKKSLQLFSRGYILHDDDTVKKAISRLKPNERLLLTSRLSESEQPKTKEASIPLAHVPPTTHGAPHPGIFPHPVPLIKSADHKNSGTSHNDVILMNDSTDPCERRSSPNHPGFSPSSPLRMNLTPPQQPSKQTNDIFNPLFPRPKIDQIQRFNSSQQCTKPILPVPQSSYAQLSSSAPTNPFESTHTNDATPDDVIVPTSNPPLFGAPLTIPDQRRSSPPAFGLQLTSPPHISPEVTSVDESLIAEMIAMGFSRDVSITALERANGSIERAVTLLTPRSIQTDISYETAATQFRDNFTSEQLEACQRLVDRGFRETNVIQVLIACDFDEETALTLLSLG